MMALYGILSIGVHLHLHYCCEKIADISFTQSKACCHEDHTGSGNADCISKHCCSFEDISFQLDQSHQATFFKVPIVAAGEVSSAYISAVSVIDSEHSSHLLIPGSDPPPGVPLFIRHQSLVLYA